MAKLLQEQPSNEYREPIAEEGLDIVLKESLKSNKHSGEDGLNLDLFV
jgi:hypothetical protein